MALNVLAASGRCGHKCIAVVGPKPGRRSTSTRQRRVGSRSQGFGQGVSANGSQPDDEDGLETKARSIIDNDPATRAKLDRIGAAQQRVSELQAAKAEIEAQIAAGSGGRTAADGSEAQNMAAANITLAADEFEAAQREYMSAEGNRRALQAAMQQEEDRIQSIVAALVGGAAGFGISLPLVVASQHPDAAKLFSLGAASLASALFAIVYRYAVRTDRDAANSHLQGGIIGAFGLTQGLAQASVLLGTSLDQGDGLSLPLFGQMAILAGTSMLQFAAVALALRVAISRGIFTRISQQE